MKTAKNTKKVFFTCSTTQFKSYRPMYNEIIGLLKSSGLSVQSNISLDEFANESDRTDFDVYSNSGTYFSTMKKVAQADILVIECTAPSMSIGHIVTHALSSKKPVLLLSLHKDDDPQDLFINGSEDPLLEFRLYAPKDLSRIIKAFLRKTSNEPKVRLNFVIEKDISDKLEWLVFRTKLSKTDILRKAINNLGPESE